MDGHIKVTTEALANQAEAVSTLISKATQLFDDMKQKIDSTASYWVGNAADVHRRKYNSKQATIDEAIRRLNENVTDLRIMAGVYSEAEIEATRQAEELVTSVID